MPNLPFDPTSLVFGITAIFLFLLYLHEHNLRKKTEYEADQFLQEIKEKGWETLHQSIKKSEDILAEAELGSIKAVAENKLSLNKMEAGFNSQLAKALEESKQTITVAQQGLLNFMNDLQKRSAEFEEAGKRAGEQRINSLFERVENRISDFLVLTEQNTTSTIELELKATRQFIDTYKNRQLKLIDENILAMMEQTLNIVLGKKMSLKDQLDLIYEALEKAKVEKFIV